MGAKARADPDRDGADVAARPDDQCLAAFTDPVEVSQRLKARHRDGACSRGHVVRDVVGLGRESGARQGDVLGERALGLGHGIRQVTPHGGALVDVRHSVAKGVEGTRDVPSEHEWRGLHVQKPPHEVSADDLLFPPR